MIKPNVRPAHVLVVDDEPTMSEMLQNILKSQGFNISVACCGEESLQILQDQAIDVIVIDPILVDYTAEEICHSIKKNEKTAHIPIIVLSNRHHYESKINKTFVEADDFLMKPFDREDLVTRILRVTEIRGDTKENVMTNSSSTILELKNIIEEERIVPYFQPIYLLRPFRLLGIEVLSRAKTESQLVNPELLFNAALHHGCYFELEMVGWKKAINVLMPQIQEEKVFFNCNPQLVETAKFESIYNLFKLKNIDANQVVLEITERTAIKDYKYFYKCLDDYRRAGFKFAVDDVGGGYASLESIVETRPEIVKIDRHIVKGLPNDPYKKSIIKFIVSFCREHGIISVAEGVETVEVLDELIALGVDAAQGYYLFSPTADLDLREMHACVKLQ